MGLEAQRTIAAMKEGAQRPASGGMVNLLMLLLVDRDADVQAEARKAYQLLGGAKAWRRADDFYLRLWRIEENANAEFLAKGTDRYSMFTTRSREFLCAKGAYYLRTEAEHDVKELVGRLQGAEVSFSEKELDSLSRYYRLPDAFVKAFSEP